MRRTLTLILAALLLTSSMSISAFAAEETDPTTDTTTETTAPETETPETETPETDSPETSAPETSAPETTPPETSAPEITPPETSAPETTPPETSAPETKPENSCPIVKPEVKEPHSITFTNMLLEKGFVMASRKSAKEGEVVILQAYEHEFERDGKNYKYEFKGWYSNADTMLIHVSKTMAFFYMPDEDVEITPIFRIVDTTEYFDWDSVVKDVDKLRRNQSLEVDMEDETTIPDSVLKALAGTDADVTFITDDCIYTINGMDVVMNNAEEAAEGYYLTYEDYNLTNIQKRKIRNTDLLAVKVNVNTDHEVKAEVRCFASKDKDAGYLYRVSGQNFTFVSAIDIKNGEAIIPVTESGNYVVTSQALIDTKMQIDADSNNIVAIVGGKLVPLSAVVDGKLTFKVETSGKILFSEYTNTYYDVRNHKYKSQIDFVNARGLLDGVTSESWQPNAGITTGEFMRAIARLRGIPDKDAYDYCTQLDIFTYEYVEDDLLSRNEMSVIFTNFINHLIQYPKSFGGYSMKGFYDNGAAWVGARFRELKNNSPIEYDWKENASRAEAAYLLQAAVQTIVAGD